jgi:hypothetical protein
VGSDLYARLWKTYRRDEAKVPQYDNTVRFSFGLELAPSTDKAVALYKKLPWRIGVYHEPGYYIDSSGHRTQETFFTFGTSMLFKENRGAIDLAFEFGKRGNIFDNGAEEWVFRQSFSIVGWERWFEKRKY